MNDQGRPQHSRRGADAASTPADGPTQRADEQHLPQWTGRPWLARLIRALVLVAPFVSSFLATRWVARNYPAHELGISRWAWFGMVLVVGLAVLVAVDRLARRFLPLAALFKLSLVFPDQAPSRFSMAMRTGTTKQLERRIHQITTEGIADEDIASAQTMLELVAALSTHDRLTRGHCERVRAYTDMIAEEMGISEHRKERLRWAALLHDVGKLFVPFEVLNKEGRPTEHEWELLKSHTWKGDELAAPLAGWLGEFHLAIRNHHERWDGMGYPDKLKGEEIPLGARIVAVADTFDVMTSKRSYKEPRPATEAREEIARCAGSQFDPAVARAFLNIGIGRLRMAVGPLSWLANIPAAGQVPIAPAVSPILSTGAGAVSALAAAAGLTIGGITAVGEVAPPELALTDPVPTTIVLTTTTVPATTAPTTITLPPPTTTTTVSASTTGSTTTTATTPAPTTTAAPTTTIASTTTTLDPFVGLPPAARDVVVRLDPSETQEVTLLAETTSGTITFSIEGTPSGASIVLVDDRASAAAGTAVTVGARVQITAGTSSGTDRLSYVVCDGAGRCDRAGLSVIIAPIATTTTTTTTTATTTTTTTPSPNTGPTIDELADLTMVGATPGSVRFRATDVDGDPLSIAVSGLPTGLQASLQPSGISLTWEAGRTDPDPADTGRVHTVTVEVADGRGGVDSDTFDLRLAALSPLRAALRISEVNLRAGTTADEFVEILNIAGTPVDFRGVQVQDFPPMAPSDLSFGGATAYGPLQYTTTEYEVDTDSYLVVWLRPADRPATLPVITVKPQVINRFFGSYPGGDGVLGDSGDDVWLLDGEGRVIDYLAWGSGGDLFADVAVPTALWDPSAQDGLALVSAGQSIAAATDPPSSDSACWEPTGSGLASGRCPIAAFVTVDRDTVFHDGFDQRTTSAGEPNG